MIQAGSPYYKGTDKYDSLFICDSILPSFLEFVKTILIHVKILYNIESKRHLHFVENSITKATSLLFM